MKLNSYYDDDDIVYVAFYKGKPYAISDNKKLVRRYMETHRKLDRDDYDLDKFDGDNPFISVKQELILSEYNGVYITERDIIMCGLFNTDMESQVKNLYTSLLSFTRILGQSEASSKDINRMVDAMKSLNKIYNDHKLMDRLDEIDQLDNPFIYSSMDEYDRHVIRYEEYINSRNRWYLD